MVHPDLYLKYVYVDELPDIGAKNLAYAVFQSLDRLKPIEKGCAVDEDTGIPFIGFGDEAQAFFVEWYTALEERLRSGSLSGIQASHLAKYRSLMPSLALIFHLIVERDAPQLAPVSLHAAELAAAWCQFLEAHANRIYQAACDGDPEAAIRLAEKIKQSLPNPCTFRQIAQKGWSGLDNVEDVRKAVGILEDRGVLKVVQVQSDDLKGRGRPSEKIWFNPQFLSGSKGGDA
jgi:putative DNA primase/helicase